jgi:hypothetical protein
MPSQGGGRPAADRRPSDGRASRTKDNRRSQRDDLANKVRNEWKGDRFKDGHRGDWNDRWDHHDHWNWGNHNYDWWKAAAWGGVASWIGWNIAEPFYYDYGYDGTVYYNDDQVYVQGQYCCTEDEYFDQASTLAASVPSVSLDKVEWMPLGVFALTSEDNVDPKFYVQLAISKEGIIAGTFYNIQTDQTQDLEGMVDKTTGRAAWKVVDKETPVMETGIYNLTEDQTPVLIHFADGSTQEWTMVRLEKQQ